MIVVPFKISITLLIIYGVIASLTATVFLPRIFSTLESTVYKTLQIEFSKQS